MSWWKKLLGIKTPVEKKLAEIEKLQKLAFEAQRKGDLSLAGKHQLDVDILYDEIEEINAQLYKKAP